MNIRKIGKMDLSFIGPLSIDTYLLQLYPELHVLVSKTLSFHFGSFFFSNYFLQIALICKF